MAGRVTLDHLVVVRIHPSQPFYVAQSNSGEFGGLSIRKPGFDSPLRHHKL